MRKMLKVDLYNDEHRYIQLTLLAAPYAVLDALEKLRLEEKGLCRADWR